MDGASLEATDPHDKLKPICSDKARLSKQRTVFNGLSLRSEACIIGMSEEPHRSDLIMLESRF